MAVILISAILNFAILDSAILLKTLTPTNSIWLKVIHSDSTWWWQPSWIQPFSTKNFTHSFWLTLMMAAILNSAILDSAFAQKNFTHVFSLNLMMVAILNSANLDSAILLKTLTPTNTIWLKVIHSDSTWWWQPSWIQPFSTKKLHSFILTHLDDGSHIEFCHLGFSYLHKKTSLMYSHSTWWWLPFWILPFWIQPFCSKLWLQLIQSDSKLFILTQLDDGSCLGFSHFPQKILHSFILTQLDDGSHIEFCHLGINHLSFSSQTHSHLPRLVHNIYTKKFIRSFWLNLTIAAILNSAILNSAILYKKTSLIHSDSTWWWQPSWTLPSWIQPFCTKRTSLIHSDSTWWWEPSWILPCWIQTLPSWIQTPCYLLLDSLKNTLPLLWLWLKLIQCD